MRFALSFLPAIVLAAASGAMRAPDKVQGVRPPVEIGTARAVAGQRVIGALKVAEDADGTPIVLPIELVTGPKPGPVAWVQAVTHGDEYGGARALQDVVRGLDPAGMSGT